MTEAPDPGPKTELSGPRARALRFAYLVAGFILLALGIIGAFLPLMPTTIFVILAAGCFARSNRRVEAWLLAHRRFGPMIIAWRSERAIPRRGKILASIGMVVGYVAFLFGARPELWLNLLVLAFFVACASYVISRPEPTQPPQA
ncbi:MAG: YbaN family protein [Devosia sp.]